MNGDTGAEPPCFAFLSSNSTGLLKVKHGRGGWYFGSKGFRPAPDIRVYLEEAHRIAGSDVLGDADIVLAVPFAVDILFFGYNHSTDEVTAKDE